MDPDLKQQKRRLVGALEVLPEFRSLPDLNPISNAHTETAAILLLLLAIALNERGLHGFEVSKGKRRAQGG